ncbi:hypothetical protein BDV96DRAFT_639002 [Lophiotrema nucula]|uniref:Uncharacterized protein n=1 Tax=Lophiotrema nucula TaxID=690887 RepID=A0A6A5YEN6_9PLEO|nr:hypothetical protein BDV96DRAFT_639002 [Lophiotrema nucula]
MSGNASDNPSTNNDTNYPVPENTKTGEENLVMTFLAGILALHEEYDENAKRQMKRVEEAVSGATNYNKSEEAEALQGQIARIKSAKVAEQNRWIFEYPDSDIARRSPDFVQLYGTTRDRDGIIEFVKKMRREFDELVGQMEDTLPKQNPEPEEERREEDLSEEEPPELYSGSSAISSPR